MSNSSLASLKSEPDITLSLNLSTSVSSEPRQLKPEERGIKLIQLLLTCANHTSSGNLHRADACLRQISHLASMSGDSMQRLSSRFASALAVRVVKRWPGLYKALNHSGGPSGFELDQARSIYFSALPYLTLAYAIISQALIQSMYQQKAIHFIDLGSGDPNLWIPILQSLAAKAGATKVKITCVSTNKQVLQKLGLELVKEAESLNMGFQFEPVNVSLRELTPEMVKVQSGEAVAITSVLSLHILLAEDDRVDAHFGFNKSNGGIKDCKKMRNFLEMIQSMCPKALLLVEPESDHNLNRLMDRFVEGLHYYSALFDSIDAAYKSNRYSSRDRDLLEEIFGKEIENIVACEGVEREERHERYGRWMVRLGGVGFRPARLWYDTMDEAKRAVEACGLDGYKIVDERACLMICWHDRPIYSVSAWNCFS